MQRTDASLKYKVHVHIPFVKVPCSAFRHPFTQQWEERILSDSVTALENLDSLTKESYEVWNLSALPFLAGATDGMKSDVNRMP